MKRLASVLTPLLVVGPVGCGGGSKVTAPSPVTAQRTRTSSGLPGAFVSSLTAGGTALQAGTLVGVFRSTDGGRTWVALGSDRMSGPTVTSLTVSGTTVQAATARNGIRQYPL